METTARRSKVLVTALILVVCCSSCRFKAPSIGEGQEFSRQGVYPLSTPTWVRPDPASGTPQASSVGIMPRSYSSPDVAQLSRASAPSGEAQRASDQTPVERARMLAKNSPQSGSVAGSATTVGEASPSSATQVGSAVAESSPLDRIEKSCPGSEKLVNAALTTTDVSARISKFEVLTVRCADSTDLWLWLGKDYAEAKKFSDAERCYRRVLTLDSANKEAQKLLGELEMKKGSSGSTSLLSPKASGVGAQSAKKSEEF